MLLSQPAPTFLRWAKEKGRYIDRGILPAEVGTEFEHGREQGMPRQSGGSAQRGFLGDELHDATGFAKPRIVSVSKVEANGLFINSTEKRYRYAQKIPPIDGYEDFTCHADSDHFWIDMGGVNNENDYLKLTPNEYAARILASSTYKGGAVRIISCQAGAKPNGAAQQLANALGVSVLAPTETVHVTEKGELFVSDNVILAEIWYSEQNRSIIKKTGKWIVFNPQKE